MKIEKFNKAIEEYLSEANIDGIDEDAKYLDLEGGRFYRPPHTLIRFLTVVVTFVFSIFMGNVLILTIDAPETKRVFFYAPGIAIYLFGYVFWKARVQAILWSSFGKHIFWNIISHIFRWKKPEKLSDILPPAMSFINAGLRAQKAASVFLIWGFTVTALFIAINLLFGLAYSFFSSSIVIFLVCISWSYFLYFLGRREYLLIGDEE